MNLGPILESSERFIQNRYREFERYFSLDQFDQRPITLLVGQRGVGKTTLLIQYIHRKRKASDASSSMYLQADHISLGDHSLYEIASSFYAEGGRLLCIDEIHKCPDWSKQLKSIIDSFPKLNLVVSGSSILELKKG